MKSSYSLLSPPPCPHPAPLPLSSSFSSLAGCPELDLSLTLSPSHTHMKPHHPKKSQLSDQPELMPRPQGQTGKKVCFEEPVVFTVMSDPPRNPLSQQPNRAQRGSRGRHYAPRQWVEPSAVTSSQDPSCLERAELNTTLALKAELQSLQGAEFNSQKAVQEILQRSERTKNLINTKATEVVNVSPSQFLYTSLVSVDVQEDQLITQALQDRLLLAPPTRWHGNKTADGPSLVPFMSSDRFRQKSLSPEEEPENIKPRPLTHPAPSTFDLYRRQRRHEATP